MQSDKPCCSIELSGKKYDFYTSEDIKIYIKVKNLLVKNATDEAIIKVLAINNIKHI